MRKRKYVIEVQLYVSVRAVKVYICLNVKGTIPEKREKSLRIK